MAGVSAVHLPGRVRRSGRRDVPGPSDTAPGTDPVRLDIHAAQITLRDPSPPAVAAISGPLTAPGRTETRRDDGDRACDRRRRRRGRVHARGRRQGRRHRRRARLPGGAVHLSRHPVPATRRRRSRSTPTPARLRRPHRAGRDHGRGRQLDRLRADRAAASTTAAVPPLAPRSASTIAGGRGDPLHAADHEARAAWRRDHGDLPRRPQARLPTQEPAASCARRRSRRIRCCRRSRAARCGRGRSSRSASRPRTGATNGAPSRCAAASRPKRSDAVPRGHSGARFQPCRRRSAKRSPSLAACRRQPAGAARP